jgi:PAS domain S-box-containing protein
VGGDGDGQRVLDLGSGDVLDALFASELGVALIDRDLRFVRVNPALARMNGLPPELHVGRRVPEVVPGVADAAVRAIEKVLRTGQPAFALLEGQTAAAPSVQRRWAGQYVPIGSRETVAVLALVHELDNDVEGALHARSVQLALALDAGRLGAWEWDARSGLVRWSPDLERLYGVEEGSFGGTFDAYLELVPADVRDAVRAATVNGLRTGHVHIEHRVERPDGTIRHVEGRGVVTRNAAGEVTGMVGVAFDVTDRADDVARMKAQTSALAALNEASTDLHRERDRDAVARAVPSAALRVCNGDFGVFAVRDNSYAPWTVDATAGPVPPSWDPARHLTATSRDDVATATVSPDGTELVAMLRPDAHGSSLAAVVVGRARGGFTSTERQVLASLAMHASAALDNAALHASAALQIARREHALQDRDRVARILQESLLPPELPSIEGVELAAAYRPRADDIGGDFYDVFPVRGRAWGIALGDVCGKGPEAAATTALARHTLRAAAMTHRAPRRILATLNDVLLGRGGDDSGFLTAVFVRLETNEHGARLTAAIAGHPPAVVLRADGTLERYGPTGRLLGVCEDAALRDVGIDLGHGDSCIVYTDGATDVRHEHHVFGDERLAEVIAGCRGMSAAGIASSVERAVVDFQDGEVEDDLAIVVIAVPPRRPAG